MSKNTKKATDTFAVNSYSYTLEWSALDFINHLADHSRV
jgi:hypothetical protein